LNASLAVDGDFLCCAVSSVIVVYILACPYRWEVFTHHETTLHAADGAKRASVHSQVSITSCKSMAYEFLGINGRLFRISGPKRRRESSDLLRFSSSQLFDEILIKCRSNVLLVIGVNDRIHPGLTCIERLDFLAIAQGRRVIHGRLPEVDGI
jgi:hypothetical protein